MASENNVVDILKSIVGEIKQIANSDTVIGDAVTVGNRTVIPVIKISFGFGAGGGQGADQAKSGFGGGGGGGAKIEPVAFIIMDEHGISLLPTAKGKWDSVIEAIPGIARTLKDTFKSDKGENPRTSDPGKTDI